MTNRNDIYWKIYQVRNWKIKWIVYGRNLLEKIKGNKKLLKNFTCSNVLSQTAHKTEVLSTPWLPLTNQDILRRRSHTKKDERNISQRKQSNKKYSTILEATTADTFITEVSIKLQAETFPENWQQTELTLRSTERI